MTLQTRISSATQQILTGNVLPALGFVWKHAAAPLLGPAYWGGQQCCLVQALQAGWCWQGPAASQLAALLLGQTEQLSLQGTLLTYVTGSTYVALMCLRA